MLLEFSVQNFLSINEPISLSMVGSNPVKELENLEQEGSENVFFDFSGKQKILKSGVIYGANGSGKSNLIKAMGFMRKFILFSANDSQADDRIKVIPFKLNSENENMPSSFEIVFSLGEFKYRYGFETDSEKVFSEWLFRQPNTINSKESRLFTREFQDISVNSRGFKEGAGLEKRTRANALFLSVVAQFNGEESINIFSWFKKSFNLISGLKDSTRSFTISKYLKEEKFQRQVVQFFKLINSGIENISIENIADAPLSKLGTESLEQMPDDVKDLLSDLSRIQEKLEKSTKLERKTVLVQMIYNKYNHLKKSTEDGYLDFGLESTGNKKLFGLLGPWFDTIENGGILVIDELDSRLHTLLTMELVKLFHSKINIKNAQLIFASHDTNLLRKDLFRRDQIWFTEKNKSGGTDLYSLVEYKINQAQSIRNDASYEKDYLLGKYGGIPYFGNISSFLNDFVYEQEVEK